MATARDAAGAAKRERKTNFNDDELSCLLEENAQHASVLQCKLSNNVTNLREKKQMWDEIAMKVNSRGNERRTVAELKKKSALMKSASLRASLPQDRGWQERKRAVVCQPGAGHTWC